LQWFKSRGWEEAFKKNRELQSSFWEQTVLLKGCVLSPCKTIEHEKYQPSIKNQDEEFKCYFFVFFNELRKISNWKEMKAI
jgi:hypothetical protein